MGREGLDAHGPSAAPVADARTSTTLGTTSWQSCPKPTQVLLYRAAANAYRACTKLSSSRRVGGPDLDFQRAGLVGCRERNNQFISKNRTRLLWATRHTGGVYHRPSLQSHNSAKQTRVLEFPFSGWPCGAQGRQRRIGSCHDGAAQASSPRRVWGCGNGILDHRQGRENRDGGAGPSQSKKFPIMTGALAKGRLDAGVIRSGRRRRSVSRASTGRGGTGRPDPETPMTIVVV
ncbi:hypothetical protein EDB80DRAFT_96527 [Ilyonectria destructans]|nr:hypothetical protein EDB80DRAFT_96527 [Ilyonectria destructans]